MAAIASFGSLEAALSRAISYLTRSLVGQYTEMTITNLQVSLELNLKTQFAPTWVPSDPARGSGRRCLTLSPNGPPRALYNACQFVGVEWSVWMASLGGMEFDMFIDPGCVSIRYGNWESGKVRPLLTVWSEAAQVKKLQLSEEQIQAQLKTQAYTRATNSKTFAQQIMIADAEEDDELFAMISHEIREPVWVTPTESRFPISIPARSESASPVSVVSAISSHSRTSSCSSGSSSGFSFSTTSVSSNSDGDKPKFKLSRREKARQAKVYIDPSKTDVTNYDGGKTTVLTGGVMLGAPAKPKASVPVVSVMQKKVNSATAGCWRSTRA